MALVVKTAFPKRLLRLIKAGIREGKIRTWIYDSTGHFTHAARQWKDQAWIKPVVKGKSLKFVVLLPAWDVKQGVEGYYQGKFSQMLHNHFGYSAVVISHAEEEAVSLNSQ